MDVSIAFYHQVVEVQDPEGVVLRYRVLQGPLFVFY